MHISQSNSGKTHAASYLLTNWTRLYDAPFDKLTIVYEAEQSLLSSRLIDSTPTGVEVTRRIGLTADALDPEKLRSPKKEGLAVLLLDDQLHSFIQNKGPLFEALHRLVVIHSHHYKVRSNFTPNEISSVRLHVADRGPGHSAERQL